MQQDNTSFGAWVKAFSRSALWAGGIVGGLEALIVVSRILSSNAVELALLLQIVIFVSFAIALFAGLLLIFNLIFLPVLYLPLKMVVSRFQKIGPSQLSWVLNFLTATFFCFLFWAHYNSGRSLLSGKSLLYSGLAFVGALVLAEIAARLMHGASDKLKLWRKGKPRPFVVVWLLVLGVALFMNSNGMAGVRSAKPNVLLLIIDTLRADRLGCYGYDKPTSPSIDRVASESVLFEQAYVSWASSLPSHSSIMTSMQPYHHGAFPNGKSLNAKLLTLPKILHEYGYKNAGFVSNTLVGNQYNFELGYDTFTDLTKFDYHDTSWQMWVRTLDTIRLFDKITDRDLFTDLALSWIEKHRHRPFFLWGQWLQPHAPYEPPARHLAKFEESYSGIADGSLKQIFDIRQGNVTLSDSDQQHYSALYDGEVAWSDEQIGAVYDKLTELELLENSIVIITSDHGENMLEHGLEYGHAGVNESSVRIPLLVRLPGGKRMQLAHVVQSIDIAPTVLDLLDIPMPDQFHGRSVVPLVEGQKVEWPNEAFSVGFWKKRNFFGLRNGDWKLILDVRQQNQTWALYHLPTDPHERKNRYETEPGTATKMKHAMEIWLANEFENLDLVYKPGGFFEEDFDEKTIQRLRTLGYIK